MLDALSISFLPAFGVAYYLLKNISDAGLLLFVADCIVVYVITASSECDWNLLAILRSRNS